MAKGEYYAGMATAPQVQPADLATPFAKMLDQVTEQNIQFRKEQLVQQKINDKFSQSQLERLDKVVSSSEYGATGLDNLNIAAKNYSQDLSKNFEMANLKFSNKEIDDTTLQSFTTGLVSSAAEIATIGKKIADFQTVDAKLEAENKSSAWNDVVFSAIQKLGNKVKYDTDENGIQSLISEDEDGVPFRIPSNSIKSFFQAREATDVPGVLEDIVEASKPRILEGKNTTYERYLTSEGTLTPAQENILTQRIMNFDPRDVYDAAVRYGIVGDNYLLGQIPLVTDITDEGEITNKNLDLMRGALLAAASRELVDRYRNIESSKPKSQGSGRTPQTSTIYNPESGIFSYKKGASTSVLIRSGFTGKDVIGDKPSGNNSEVPPNSYISDVRLSPNGLEVWGVQIVNKKTGGIMDLMNASSLSDVEIEAAGGTRKNFHKVIDPSSNEIAVSQLQRVFDFKTEDYKNTLDLNLVPVQGKYDIVPNGQN